MSRFVFLFVCIVSLMGVGSLEAMPDDVGADKICKALVEVLAAKGGAEDPRVQAALESHRLTELLVEGDGNLAIKAPWLIMNAAQRAYDLVMSQGVREVADARTGSGTLKRYAFFSDAVSLTGHKHIVGQLTSIEALVSLIHSKAFGNPTAVNVPLLVGPPGTGKSYILALFQAALRRATGADSRFFTYTYEWVDLHTIPALKAVLPESVKNPQNPQPLPEYLNDSPFALLPTPIQDFIIQQARGKVIERIGMEPKPKREISSAQSRFIRDQILLYYRALAEGEGKQFGPAEQLQALNRHVRIKRLVLGDEATSPVLPYQGREPNTGALFGGVNAFYKMAVGASHPMAFDYGQVPRANQGLIFWDELLKNEAALTSILLNLFSSGVVSISGAAPTPIDVLHLAATNTADIPKIIERDPQSPLLDRGNQISWPLLINPEEVGRVLLMEIPSLQSRILGQGRGKAWVPTSGLELFKLFPEREPMRPIQTPHARYGLRISNGAKEYHIAPHSLEFMSYVIALSRMNFDPEKVRDSNTYPLVKVKDRVFIDPVTRLRVLLGEVQVPDSQLAELARISVASDEGSFGITHRDVERWWERTLQEAEKSHNHRTITPFLLNEVLEKILREKAILAEKADLRNFVALFARMVFQEFVQPGIRDDLDLALGRSEGREVIDQIYDEVVQEIRALHQHAGATRYMKVPQNEMRAIDFDRLKAIQAHFKAKTRRDLNFAELATYNMSFAPARAQDDAGPSRHPGLLAAIASYHSNIVLRKESMTLSRLLDVAAARVTDIRAEETERARELQQVLEEDLGYNLHSARVALEMVASMQTNKQPQ